MDSIPDLLQTSSVIGSAIQDTQTVSAKSLVSEYNDDDDDDDELLESLEFYLKNTVVNRTGMMIKVFFLLKAVQYLLGSNTSKYDSGPMHTLFTVCQLLVTGPSLTLF